jgi:hypothetical protein
MAFQKKSQKSLIVEIPLGKFCSFGFLGKAENVGQIKFAGWVAAVQLVTVKKRMELLNFTINKLLSQILFASNKNSSSCIYKKILL